MKYINKQVKRYRRVYVREIIRDIWEMEYTPLALALLLLVGIYVLATTKLIEFLIGGF